MYYKTYESKYGLAIAVCDEDICGKKLKFKDTDFFVNPRFYKDKQGSEEAVIPLLKEAVNINLVGKESVECGKKAGVVEEKSIIMIGNIPHAQVVAIAI